MKVRNLRWWLAILVACAIGLSYLDRLNLPVAIDEIQKSIEISDSQFGLLGTLFLLAYAIMYAGGGKLLDILGTRVGLAVMIAWWSMANALHGTVSTVYGLGVCRFLLGLGEGGAFPGAAKAVSEWFPAKERSFAFGIFNTGSSVGSVVAAPLIALIVTWLNWRWTFFIFGSAGFVWALAWLYLYALPQRHRLITEGERDYVVGELAAAAAEGTAEKVPWIHLFTHRKLWGLLLGKFFSDAAFYFVLFWLPKYLGDARGLDIKEIGYLAWIPYAAMGVGSFVGGWTSSHLMSRNVSLDHSRKIALAISAAMMPFCVLIPSTPLAFAILFFSMALCGHQFFSTIMQTLAADLYPSRMVGSVAGLAGAFGCFGGMASNYLGGYLVEASGYTPVFIIAGFMHPLSLLLILVVVGKIECVVKPMANA